MSDRAALEAATRGGDPLARMALHDLAEESGDPLTPYVVGRCYLVQMTTLYYLGRVVRQGPGWLVLDDASWVHWTGRLSTLVRRGLDAKGWPTDDRRPRTERVGDGVILHVGQQGAAAIPWPHDLPKESITQ